MPAGAFRHLVTVQKPGTGRDPIGQPMPAWTKVDDFYADIRYLRGLEAVKAGAETATAQVSIRLRTFREDLTSDMRVLHGTTVYQVVAPPLPDMQRRRHVDLVCSVTK